MRAKSGRSSGTARLHGRPLCARSPFGIDRVWQVRHTSTDPRSATERESDLDEDGTFDDEPDVVQVDVNTALAGDLALVPGIGPSLARRIVDAADCWYLATWTDGSTTTDTAASEASG